MVTEVFAAATGVQAEQYFRQFFSTLTTADVMSAENGVSAHDILIDETIAQLTHDLSVLDARGINALSAHITDSLRQETRPRIRLSVDYICRLIRHCEQSTEAALRTALLTLFAQSALGAVTRALTATQAECSELLRDIPTDVAADRRRRDALLESAKAAATHFVVDESADESVDDIVDSKDPDDYEFTADTDDADDVDSHHSESACALTSWTDIQLKIGEILRLLRADLLSAVAVANECKVNETLIQILTLAAAHPHMFKGTDTPTSLASPATSLTTLHIYIALLYGSIMSTSPSLIPALLPAAMCEALCWWPIPYSAQSASKRLSTTDITLRRQTAISIVGNLSALCLNKPSDSLPISAIQYTCNFVSDGIAAISEQLTQTTATISAIINAPSKQNSSEAALTQVYALCNIYTLYISPQITSRSHKSDETDVGVTLVALNVIARLAEIAVFDSNERVHNHQDTAHKRCNNCRLSTSVVSSSALNSSLSSNVHMPFQPVQRLVMHIISVSSAASNALIQSIPFMTMIDCSCCYAPYTVEYILVPFFLAQHQHNAATNDAHDIATANVKRRVVIRKTQTSINTSTDEDIAASMECRLQNSISSLHSLLEALQQQTSSDVASDLSFASSSSANALFTIEEVSREVYAFVSGSVRRSNLIQELHAQYKLPSSASRTPLHNSLISFVHSLHHIHTQCMNALTDMSAALQQHRHQRDAAIDQHDKTDDATVERRDVNEWELPREMERRHYQSKLAAYERTQRQLGLITRMLKAVFDANKKD